MPTNHPTPETLDAFVRRELPPEAMGEVDRHLAECDACRTLAPGAVGGQALLAAVEFERGRHLSFEELESLVDAGPDAIDTLARQHVAGCESCQRELADLEAFEKLLEREAHSTAPVVTRPVAQAPAIRRGWVFNPFAWGAAAAAVVALFVVWPALRQQLDQTLPSPSGFVVRLGGATAPEAERGPNALRPGASAPLPAEVIQALRGARQRAEETGEAQTVDISIRGREFEALTDELRVIGAVEGEPDVDVEPDLNISLSVTLLPKD